MSRPNRQVCKTPGAFWHFSRDTWSPKVQFSVSMPREVLEAIDEKRAKRLEKAFHDAIEPILGPIWPKAKRQGGSQ